MRKKSLLFILFSFIILLGGCGKATDSKEVKYSEIMNSKDNTISYLVENEKEDTSGIGKNSRIISYIVFNNGKRTVYEGGEDETLGNISKKDDDKKLEYIKKHDKKEFESDKKSSLNILKDEKSNELAKELEDFKYDKPKERDLSIELKTDSSGNNTQKEFFNIARHGFLSDSSIDVNAIDVEEIYDTDKKISNPNEYGYYFTNVVSPTEIYDKKIAGLSNIDGVEDKNSYDEPAYEDYKYLVTEVGDKTEKFEMDQPDDENVKVKD